MSPKSIRMIDKWAALRRNPRHNRNVVRGLTKAVRSSLLVDSQRRADEAATAIGEFLEPEAGETDPCRAYAVLKHWYQHASVRVTNPYQAGMDKVRGDF